MQWMLTVLTIVVYIVRATTDDQGPQALDQDYAIQDYANQEYANQEHVNQSYSDDDESLPEDASFLKKGWCRIRCFGSKCCGHGSCQCLKLTDKNKNSERNSGHLGSLPGYMGPRPGHREFRSAYTGHRPGYMGPRPGFMGPRPRVHGRMGPHWKPWMIKTR